MATLSTLTHARLRAAQGDLDGARQILDERLRLDPADPEAAALRARLDDRRRARLYALAVSYAAAGRTRSRGKEESMLREQLERIHGSVEGARTVALLAMDGMIVDSAGESRGGPWEWVAANYTEIMRKVGRANDEAGLAEPDELVSAAPGATLVFRRLTPEYVLLVAIDPEQGYVGRARFEARMASERLAAELS